MNIIAAMTKDHVIGKDNKLLWHISADLKRFKKLTSGNTIIMGRKTYESIGKPLPNRTNIVISRVMQPVEGVIVCRSFNDAIEKANEHKGEIFVIGGEQIYTALIGLCHKMYLTIVDGDYAGDTYFPEFNEDLWDVVDTEKHDGYTFKTYVRK